MYKVVVLTLSLLLTLAPALAKTDRASEAYLKNKHHFAIMNPLAENIIQKEIKKSLHKKTGANFKVDFDAYTLSSLKQGVFKNLELESENINIEGISVPYLHLKSLSDYNRLDYTQKPIKIKSDMTYFYELNLTEDSINSALKHSKYEKNIQKVNHKAYPLFTLYDVRVKILKNRIYIIMDYNFPLAPRNKNKTFVASSGLKVENGKICANNVGIDNIYGNLSLDKVTNLINLLDPLSFTLSMLNTNDCKTKIENINIDDNIIKINGKIFIKGE